MREFARAGMGYVLRDTETATEISVGRLSVRGGDTFGEVSVVSGLPGTRSVDGYLHAARLNLCSTTARGTLAKTLTYRSAAPEVDWADLLEEFCRKVLGAERAGEPIEFAGDRPQRIAPPWRLDPILAMDKPTIAYGEGGVGKSTLATAIAVSVETGVTVIPGWVPRKASVLYLDWEATIEDFDEHIKGVVLGANIPREVRIRYRRCYRPLADQIEELVRIIRDNDIGLVIVDSIALAAGSNDGAEASDGAIRLFAGFRMLGTTVLALAHVSKADIAEPGRPARPYGSVFYTNLARATFEIRRSRSESDGLARIGMYNTKSNVRRPLLPIGLEVRQEEGGPIAYSRFELTDDKDLSQVGVSLWVRLRAILVQEPADTKALASFLETKEDTVRATLARLATKNIVQRDKETGKWHLIGRTG